MSDKAKVEAVAEILAREIFEWTPWFRDELKWPKDLNKDERAKCRKLARAVLRVKG